ncbi:phage integrase N-terminal SAM-like domain-containing protein [Leisingera sp. JC1]|uniref:phage integrase N-terminal SAM-like domain-containing protein n=1 Tax=Leisingera sp. JC1 TaxID=1855282 RepID=UPI0009F58C1E
MTEERSTPLRERMIEGMRIRGMGDKVQKAHIRAIKDFAIFLWHPPDTASQEELRAYRLHMTDTRSFRRCPASRIVNDGADNHILRSAGSCLR